MNMLKLLAFAAAILLLGGCEDAATSPCLDCSGIGSDGRYTELIEQSFATGENPRITEENFAGRVVFLTGEAGLIRVRATKRVEHRGDLERVDVDMNYEGGELEIRTENLDGLSRASVDLLVIAPPGATPRIHTAVGDIRYHGRPEGNCRFWTAVGSIRLQLPNDVSLSFELRAGFGRIYVDFPFDDAIWSGIGFVSGRIGSGADAHVVAGATVGSVRLARDS